MQLKISREWKQSRAKHESLLQCWYPFYSYSNPAWSLLVSHIVGVKAAPMLANDTSVPCKLELLDLGRSSYCKILVCSTWPMCWECCFSCREILRNKDSGWKVNWYNWILLRRKPPMIWIDNLPPEYKDTLRQETTNFTLSQHWHGTCALLLLHKSWHMAFGASDIPYCN